MSNPAQEEADRLFSYRPKATSHPEDKDPSYEDAQSDEEKPRPRTIRSSRKEDPEDYDPDEDYNDEDTTANMTTMTSTKQSYILPSTAHYANTGPKGVIADAQNYHRAKRNTLKQTLDSLADKLPLGPKQPAKKQPNPDSDHDLSDLDNDDSSSFMQQWRQQRFAELQEQYSSASGRMASPSRRRTYGTLHTVNAEGYLDAIEQSPPDVPVVVFLFDPLSHDSVEVEDELKMLAYKHVHVRFVRMHHEIAEMETVEIPAILAYKDGEVFATLSGVEREGLEGTLRKVGVLSGR